MTLVAWSRVDQRGHAVGRVVESDGGWTAHGAEVLAGPDDVGACTFHVVLDTRWHTRQVTATSTSDTGEVTLRALADGEGHWRVDGRAVPELDGCLDVDVAATPLTNTFVIRRHPDLAVGGSVTVPVAWVDVPSLAVTRVEQTYTRLGPGRWRYADEQHGGYELTVDDDGVVVDYTGLAERVWP